MFALKMIGVIVLCLAAYLLYMYYYACKMGNLFSTQNKVKELDEKEKENSTLSKIKMILMIAFLIIMSICRFMIVTGRSFFK